MPDNLRPTNRTATADELQDLLELRDLAVASEAAPDQQHGLLDRQAESFRGERSDTIYCHDYRRHATTFHRQLQAGWMCCSCGPRPGDL